MICPKCGKENLDVARFCAGCGAPMKEVPVPPISKIKSSMPKAPVTETPVVETPVAEAPVAETPVAETPVAETPVAETPVAETPVAEAPVAKTPVAEIPVAEVPVVETPIAAATTAVEPVYAEPVTPVKKKSPLKLILAIVIPILVIAATVITLFATGVIGSGGNDEESADDEKKETVTADSPVEVVELYYTSIVEEDAETYVEITLNPVALDILINTGEMDDKDDTVKHYEGVLAKKKAELEDECGKNIKVSFKDMEINKEYSEEDVKALGEDMEKKYGSKGFKAEKLQAVVIVKGKVIFEGDEDDEDERSVKVVTKYDGKWYAESGFGELSSKEAITSMLKG